MTMDNIQLAIAEIRKLIGKDLDLENEVYILQTESAWLKLEMTEDEETGENKLDINVTGGKVTFVESETDFFEDIFGGNE